jgi:enoyl-CoA hydratase/carnithine racemase
LPEKISFRNSAEMILKGDMIDAVTAKELGLVDEIFPDGNVYEATFELLKKMTGDRSTQVIHSVMKALHNARSMPVEEAMKEESKMFCELAREEAGRRLRNDE